MLRKDIIEMSVHELKRLKVIQEVIGRHITQKTAAEIMGLSERQIRRVIKAVREEGDRGVIHKGRGKQSNRKLSEKVRQKVIKLCGKKYEGFGPTLASEKLDEIEGIEISKESVRKWLIEAGLWKRRRKVRGHKQWRVRKECYGQMVQMDGSHHDWLEDRGPELVLMGYIDDATNNVFGRFYDYEGTFPAMDSFKRYAGIYGLPHSMYMDRHTTYKSNSKLTEQEILEGIDKPMSQFERAMKELGVKVIHAYSPQAKGRVERLFGVLQDRLIKEMRIKGIRTKEEANSFLDEYLPVYNDKFAVKAAYDTNMHMEAPKAVDMNRTLSIRTERTVKNDNTIALKGTLFLIEETIRVKRVVVEERLDGSLHVISNGRSLKYREITERPKKISTIDRRTRNKPPVPAKDHPWRRWQDCNSNTKRGDAVVNV